MTSVAIKRQVLALGLSLLLVAAMLTLLMLRSSLESLVQPTVTIRQASLAPPPPPPPPPAQKKQQQTEADLRLDVSGEGPGIAVSNTEVTQTIENIDLENIDMKNFSADFNLNLDVDWSAFSLDQLDGNPVLLTELQARFPQSISSRGVQSAIVRLDIFIDEGGRPSLIAIVQNQYPELEELIATVVKRARFTVPKRNGQPVRARFIWPIEFKS